MHRRLGGLVSKTYASRRLRLAHARHPARAAPQYARVSIGTLMGPRAARAAPARCLQALAILPLCDVSASATPVVVTRQLIDAVGGNRVLRRSLPSTPDALLAAAGSPTTLTGGCAFGADESQRVRRSWHWLAAGGDRAATATARRSQSPRAAPRRRADATPVDLGQRPRRQPRARPGARSTAYRGVQQREPTALGAAGRARRRDSGEHARAGIDLLAGRVRPRRGRRSADRRRAPAQRRRAASTRRRYPRWHAPTAMPASPRDDDIDVDARRAISLARASFVEAATALGAAGLSSRSRRRRRCSPRARRRRGDSARAAQPRRQLRRPPGNLAGLESTLTRPTRSAAPRSDAPRARTWPCSCRRAIDLMELSSTPSAAHLEELHSLRARPRRRGVATARALSGSAPSTSRTGAEVARRLDLKVAVLNARRERSVSMARRH